jgi:hypothetical protein
LLDPLLEFLINFILTLKEGFIFQKEYILIRRKYLAKVSYGIVDASKFLIQPQAKECRVGKYFFPTP